MKSLALLITHVLIHVVYGKDCIFPIQIPYLQDVTVSPNATGVNPVATVVIRSQYPLVKMTWFVSKYGGDDRQTFPVKDGKDGMSIKQIKLSNNDVQTSLYTEDPIKFIFGLFIVDLGCTTISGGFNLNLNARSKTFTPFESGKILNAPQEINIYESNKPFDMRFLVEGGNRYQQQDINILAYRNGSEIVIRKLEPLGPPFSVTQLSRVAPHSEFLYEVNERVTVPKEIKKFIIDFYIRQPPFGNGAVLSSWVRYEFGFLTEETTELIFAVHQCMFDQVNPFIDEEEVLVMPQEVGTMGCLYVVADGTPLPEIVLAEMSGNNVKRILQPAGNIDSLVIMTVAIFDTNILKKGEISEYRLVVKSTQGFRHQRIRIESYVPVSVSVPDRSWFTLSTLRLDLTCDVKGDFVSVGLYKSRDKGSMTSDSSTWEPITVTQTSRPGTYTFTLDLNEVLINQLHSQSKVVFCGVKTRYPTIIGYSQYQFA